MHFDASVKVAVPELCFPNHCCAEVRTSIPTRRRDREREREREKTVCKLGWGLRHTFRHNPSPFCSGCAAQIITSKRPFPLCRWLLSETEASRCRATCLDYESWKVVRVCPRGGEGERNTTCRIWRRKVTPNVWI